MWVLDSSGEEVWISYYCETEDCYYCSSLLCGCLCHWDDEGYYLGWS